MSTIGLNVHLIPSAVASAAETDSSFCDRGGVPAAGLAERDREHRLVAVDHVQREDQRDVQARLQRGLLGLVDVLDADQVEHRADLPGLGGVASSVGPGVPLAPSGPAISSWPNFSATVILPSSAFTFPAIA